MSESVLTIEEISARVVYGDKGVVFIYARVTGVACGNSVQVFSVEIDDLELLPSAGVTVSNGPVNFELPPVRIVNPVGGYKLSVKLHLEEGEVVELSRQLDL